MATPLQDRLYRAAKRLFWPGPDYGTRLRYGLRRRFLRGPAVTTLDVGCGKGALTLAAAERGGRVLGISNQPEFLRRAERFRDQLGISPERCEFMALDVYDLAGAGLPRF